jgi:CRP/FNR family transcriptional regulator, cyclic AMP receptor protein
MARRDADLLGKVPLFAGLPKRHLRAVAGIATEQVFPERATIAEEGKAGDDFYVIVEGQASVLRSGRRVARMLPGDFFGEIALLDEGPRTASVITETPLTAMAINRKPFTTLLEREPSIVLKMLEALATRLRNQERSLTG